MGRGRAKAKQVKVARQLKYNSGGTDLDRLRAEMGVGSEQRNGEPEPSYEELADRYADEDDYYAEDGEHADDDHARHGDGRAG